MKIVASMRVMGQAVFVMIECRGVLPVKYLLVLEYRHSSNVGLNR